jgi:hypothetical protein
VGVDGGGIGDGAAANVRHQDEQEDETEAGIYREIIRHVAKYRNHLKNSRRMWKKMFSLKRKFCLLWSTKKLSSFT